MQKLAVPFQELPEATTTVLAKEFYTPEEFRAQSGNGFVVVGSGADGQGWLWDRYTAEHNPELGIDLPAQGQARVLDHINFPAGALIDAERALEALDEVHIMQDVFPRRGKAVRRIGRIAQFGSSDPEYKAYGEQDMEVSIESKDKKLWRISPDVFTNFLVSIDVLMPDQSQPKKDSTAEIFGLDAFLGRAV